MSRRSGGSNPSRRRRLIRPPPLPEVLRFPAVLRLSVVPRFPAARSLPDTTRRSSRHSHRRARPRRRTCRSPVPDRTCHGRRKTHRPSPCRSAHRPRLPCRAPQGCHRRVPVPQSSPRRLHPESHRPNPVFHRDIRVRVTSRPARRGSHRRRDTRAAVSAGSRAASVRSGWCPRLPVPRPGRCC